MAELPQHLEGLLKPSAYPHPVADVELIETHISWVLLTGAFAYKIKRPVVYPFVDLRSDERRAFYCAEEWRLNRRFAPELYLELCDVREEDGTVRLDGTGRSIERCVKMCQFAQDQELDRLLDAQQIEPAALEGFGSDLADIHARLPVVMGTQPWGSLEQVRQGVFQNVEQYERAAAERGFSYPAGLRAAFEARIDALATQLAERRSQGRVRECHGDLHARNVVRRDARLVAFDCMEFEPAFRWIDVAEEIALLLTDLEARGHPRHAHGFLSGYLARSGDYGTCRVLDLYKAHRALTRAKVASLEGARDHHDAQLAEAQRALASKSPILILMTGLSGSGKTWLAKRLAADMGAVHVRSDIERKRLAGLDEHAESASGTAAGLYSPDNTSRVYEHLARCAEDVLAGGVSVIVDATFLQRSQRAAFSALARRMSARLQVVVCEAPVALLKKRIIERQRLANDASEAGLATLDWQLAHQESIAPDESLDVVKVSAAGPDPLDTALHGLMR